MNYTSSNVLGKVHQYKSMDGHLWMYISEGTENGYRALNINTDVADYATQSIANWVTDYGCAFTSTT